jgi:signal transduction histidine kinase
MTIKAKFQITTIIVTGLALIVAVFIFSTNQRLSEIIETNRRAQEIVKGVFELNILTNDYSLSRNQRSRDQWWLRHDSTARLLIEAEASEGSKEQEIIDSLRKDHRSIATTFFQLVTVVGREGSEKDIAVQKLEERLVTELLVTSQAMVSSASILATESRQKLTDQQQQLSLFTTIAVFILVAVIVVSLLSITNSILKPIMKLQQGAETIGKGDLKHRVDIKGKSEIGQLAAAFNQMTERRQRAEKALQKARDELEIRVEERTSELQSANKELEAFSYSVSHDLRTPLRAIDGFSQILLEDYRDRLNSEGKRVLNVIRDNTGRMAQLISDLLTFSRLGRAKMKKSNINMEKLARDIFEELEGISPERKLKMKMNALPPAYGDEAMIREVLVNLFSNAIKFSRKEESSLIEVGGELKGNENIYYIKDNGVGFDMRYRDKLFGVFQRLHGQEEFEGTGVGLALVQRVIHRHEGRVWAEGKVDEGATFYFTLPKKGEIRR